MAELEDPKAPHDAPKAAAPPPAPASSPEPKKDEAPGPWPPAGFKTPEEWGAEKKTPAWLLKAARVGQRWPVGHVLDEGAYDEAIDFSLHLGAKAKPKAEEKPAK